MLLNLVFFYLKVEFDSATMVPWAISNGFMQWNFAYLFGRVQASSPSIVIMHVFQEAIYAADFMAN